MCKELRELREQFMGEQREQLYAAGRGTSKHVYYDPSDHRAVVVLFSHDMEARDALHEALTECFWSTFLYNRGVLPQDPQWCVYFYTERGTCEEKIEQGRLSLVPTRAEQGGQDDDGDDGDDGDDKDDMEEEDTCDANKLARRLERSSYDVVRRCVRKGENVLVYCRTSRAACDLERMFDDNADPTPQVLHSVLRHIHQQLCDMHGFLTVHGDVKTNNILVMDASVGVAQLCDFSLSNQQSLRKPLQGASEDPRWANREGGTFQLNLPDLEETPLRYGIRNDWLGMCLVGTKVLARLLKQQGLCSEADVVHFHEVERQFWHTKRGGNLRDYRQLARVVHTMHQKVQRHEVCGDTLGVSCLVLEALAQANPTIDGD